MKALRLMLAALLLSATVFAADTYKIDPVHTTIGFSVKHMVVSSVTGRFDTFSGDITYDEKDPSKGSANLVIKTASVNTDNAYRDKDLRGEPFFDSDKYPEITFRSTQIKKDGDGWVAVGTLTMKGVSKTIEIPFTINGTVKDPMGNIRLGIEGSTKLNRKDYNLTFSKTLEAGGALVGDDVKINLLVEATRPVGK